MVYAFTRPKKETPRCPPQGHNARGLPYAWLDQGLRRIPKLVNVLQRAGSAYPAEADSYGSCVEEYLVFYDKCSEKRAYRVRASTIDASKPWFLLCIFCSTLLSCRRDAHFFEKYRSRLHDMLIFTENPLELVQALWVRFLVDFGLLRTALGCSVVSFCVLVSWFQVLNRTGILI